jgi:pimeloyl-ACP methyl ester carboxylesterase
MPTAAGIYYAQFDEGNKDQPPVILIHGAGSSHTIWPAEIRRMAGQRVMAVDLPGHGRTGGVGMQSIRAYAGHMVEFLADLGLYQAVFVGHSMGGAVALELAVNHPAHVAGLGLIAAGAYLGVDPVFLENLSNPVTAPSALTWLRQRAFGRQATPVLIERFINSIKETRTSVLYGDWRACAEFDLREQISRAEAPAWIIAGSEDQLIPIAYAHFLAGRLPASRLQIIPGAGHMALLEEPARVSQGLQQFLSALVAARFAAARVHLPAPASVSAYQRRAS